MHTDWEFSLNFCVRDSTPYDSNTFFSASTSHTQDITAMVWYIAMALQYEYVSQTPSE